MKKICISYRTAYLLAASFVVIIIISIIAAQVVFVNMGHWLAVSEYVDNADVIVVLSGGGYERIKHGIELYERGYAPELWYTGDRPKKEQTAFWDAQFALEYAVERGIPEDRITILPSTSTWEDAESIVKSLAARDDVQSIIVVTSWYHLRRSLNVIGEHLNTNNITVYYTSSDNLPYDPHSWWTRDEGLVLVLNEYMKSFYYWLRYGVVPWGTF